MRTAIAALLVTLTTGSLMGQERLFQASDGDQRTAVADELGALLADKSDLPTTIALAAVVGTRLPERSAAESQLRDSLRRANGATSSPAALRRLRSDLGDLVDVLTFTPLKQAELPVGFPGFAAVGEIELRHYPAYRMVRTTMKGGSMSAFWPLFRHIESNGIAMTTPVQMDWQASGEQRPRPTSMAFLYGDPAIEPAKTSDDVEVVECAAQTVISVGAIGNDDKARVELMGERLRAFLAANRDRFEVAGDLRTMGYNSPMVSRDRRYFEVQLPIGVRAAATRSY